MAGAFQSCKAFGGDGSWRRERRGECVPVGVPCLDFDSCFSASVAVSKTLVSQNLSFSERKANALTRC